VSERTAKFAEELDRVIADGDTLHTAMQYDCFPKEVKQRVIELLDKDSKRADDFLSKLPDLRKMYQSWYSKAHAVIKQVLPDRCKDFESYFDSPRPRKNIEYGNYVIRDYLQRLRVTRYGGSEVIVDGSAAIPRFEQQLNILKAARDVLESRLMDLTTVLQADLFDTEIDSARTLAKAGHYRAAGAVSGVVIEKHLFHICEVHNVSIRKKNPGMSGLNQLLRDANVTTIPQWRFIQHLADMRNLCDHAKGREPTREEVNDLVEGADKVLKTVF
jgi:hypothetical protein